MPHKKSASVLQIGKELCTDSEIGVSLERWQLTCCSVHFGLSALYGKEHQGQLHNREHSKSQTWFWLAGTTEVEMTQGDKQWKKPSPIPFKSRTHTPTESSISTLQEISTVLKNPLLGSATLESPYWYWAKGCRKIARALTPLGLKEQKHIAAMLTHTYHLLSSIRWHPQSLPQAILCQHLYRSVSTKNTRNEEGSLKATEERSAKCKMLWSFISSCTILYLFRRSHVM